jgi:PH (Pleckstrin Homology) domain-containing protein
VDIPVDDARRPVRLRYGPDRRFTVLAAVGTLVALVACALSSDRPGRLLAMIAAVVLALYVVSDLTFSPRLSADNDGVTIRSPFTRARLAWPQIEAIRADSRSRFGIHSTTLEIDAGAVLAVLSRRALGADPVQVAQLLDAFRQPPPRR